MKFFLSLAISLMLPLSSIYATTAAADSSQEASHATVHPRVAVVLSGGGAKGMAHIGVLKVIEKAGIPIDIVTGTSMGSLVGGLYSVGWNATQLDSLVRHQNWSFLLSDKTDYYSEDLLGRRKQSTYFLSKTFTAGKKKLAEAGGLIMGKNLRKLFDHLTVGYNDSIDFNRLPIPFSCVATNIVDNTEYDFHSGVLAEAMRASMSIPLAFTPIRKGDMVLVDGGLRNNYPADIARQMGAEYIIGATVQGPPKTADDLTSGSGVLGQIVDVNCKNKYDDNLAITDIAIRVNTAGYNAASFTDAAIDTLIRRGEEEAMKHWDELMALKRKLGLADDYRPQYLSASTEAREPVDYRTKNLNERPQHDIVQGNLGLRFDNETRKKTVNLIRWHDLRPKAEAASVRRAVHLIGEESFRDYLAVQRADNEAKSFYKREEKMARLDGVSRVYEEILARGDCLNLKDLQIDGNDLDQVVRTLSAPAGDKPRCVLAHTVKGKGVSFYENQVGSHGAVPNDEQYAQAMAEIG